MIEKHLVKNEIQFTEFRKRFWSDTRYHRYFFYGQPTSYPVIVIESIDSPEDSMGSDSSMSYIYLSDFEEKETEHQAYDIGSGQPG